MQIGFVRIAQSEANEHVVVRKTWHIVRFLTVRQTAMATRTTENSLPNRFVKRAYLLFDRNYLTLETVEDNRRYELRRIKKSPEELAQLYVSSSDMSRMPRPRLMQYRISV
jgi:hypothetical protein